MSLPAPGSHPGTGQPVDEPVITALVAERCPACGARLAPAAQWCSLCYADLRPAPASPASAAASAVTVSSRAENDPAYGTSAAAPVTGVPSPSPGTTGRPTWPCTACGVSVDVDLDACPACGTGFLGALRSTSIGLELPVVGNLGRFSDRSRVVLGAAAGLLIALLLVVITALLGR